MSTKKQVATKLAARKANLTSVKQSKTVTDMRSLCLEIGDSEYKKYKATDDLANAAMSLAAYKQAIDASKAQLVYNKLNGTTAKIAFLEEK